MGIGAHFEFPGRSLSVPRELILGPNLSAVAVESELIFEVAQARGGALEHENISLSDKVAAVAVSTVDHENDSLSQR